jgi:hypothetical protein
MTKKMIHQLFRMTETDSINEQLFHVSNPDKTNSNHLLFLS